MKEREEEKQGLEQLRERRSVLLQLQQGFAGGGRED